MTKNNGLNFGEELIFWDTQSMELLGYSKKKQYSDALFALARKHLTTAGMRSEFVVVFAEDLKNKFNFFSVETLGSVFEMLQVINENSGANTTKIKVKVEETKLKFEFELSDSKKEQLDRAMRLGALFYKESAKTRYFNAFRYQIKDNGDGRVLMLSLEHREVRPEKVLKPARHRGTVHEV